MRGSVSTIQPKIRKFIGKMLMKSICKIYIDNNINVHSKIYACVILKKILNLYDDFNNAVPTIRLYHAIERDSGNFDHIINPVEMYLPKIVTPRIIDQRIKNQ